MSASAACPKCSSPMVVISMPSRHGAAIPISWFSSVGLDHHVCTRCGFVESYVRDREALEKIEKKWAKE